MRVLNKKLDENKDIELIIISGVGEVFGSDELHEECIIITVDDYNKYIRDKVEFVSVNETSNKIERTRIPTTPDEIWESLDLFLNIDVETYTREEAERIIFDNYYNLDNLWYLDTFFFGDKEKKTLTNESLEIIRTISENVEKWKETINYKVNKRVTIPKDKEKELEEFIKSIGGQIR